MKKIKEKPALHIIGTDSNAFALLAKARRVAIKHNMDWNTIKEEAMSGNYDNLLITLMKYFEVY